MDVARQVIWVIAAVLAIACELRYLGII